MLSTFQGHLVSYHCLLCCTRFILLSQVAPSHTQLSNTGLWVTVFLSDFRISPIFFLTSWPQLFSFLTPIFWVKNVITLVHFSLISQKSLASFRWATIDPCAIPGEANHSQEVEDGGIGNITGNMAASAHPINRACGQARSPFHWTCLWRHALS